jgi:hypothetical protein
MGELKAKIDVQNPSFQSFTWQERIAETPEGRVTMRCLRKSRDSLVEVDHHCGLESATIAIARYRSATMWKPAPAGARRPARRNINMVSKTSSGRSDGGSLASIDSLRAKQSCHQSDSTNPFQPPDHAPDSIVTGVTRGGLWYRGWAYWPLREKSGLTQTLPSEAEGVLRNHYDVPEREHPVIPRVIPIS